MSRAGRENIRNEMMHYISLHEWPAQDIARYNRKVMREHAIDIFKEMLGDVYLVDMEAIFKAAVDHTYEEFGVERGKEKENEDIMIAQGDSMLD